MDGMPGPAVTPSPAATARLRQAVSRRTGDLRTRTEIDLTIAGGLVDAGEDHAAAEVLAEYQRVLRAYAKDLERIIGDAAVEREAERIVDEAAAAQEASLRLVAGSQAAEPEDAERPASGGQAPAWPGRRHVVRRALGGALTAAVIACAVIAPNVRSAPETQVAAAALEARAELEVARQRLSALQASPVAPEAVTTEARELHERILALSDEALEREVVREQIRQLLDLEQEALEQVAPRAPEARRLLTEIRAIRRSLDLDRGQDLRAAAGPASG